MSRLVVGPSHTRPSSVEAPVYRGCPCWDPRNRSHIQGDVTTKRQPFCVLVGVLSECDSRDRGRGREKRVCVQLRILTLQQETGLAEQRLEKFLKPPVGHHSILRAQIFNCIRHPADIFARPDSQRIAEVWFELSRPSSRDDMGFRPRIFARSIVAMSVLEVGHEAVLVHGKRGCWLCVTLGNRVHLHLRTRLDFGFRPCFDELGFVLLWAETFRNIHASSVFRGLSESICCRI